MVFQQKLLEKVYLIYKMTGLVMVWPASSDFWKAPLVLILVQEKIQITVCQILMLTWWQAATF